MTGIGLCAMRALALTLTVAAGMAESSSEPLQARGGAVLLTPQNVPPFDLGARPAAALEFAETSAPVLGPVKTEPGHQLLRRLTATGRAAGNAGDLYENRDRGHSRLPPEAHPQLTHVLYAEPLQAAGRDYGLALDLLFDAPLIGNSSTAFTAGPNWRSQARMALTMGAGTWPDQLYENYASGQIHVYPEHRDHDPETGDLFPANTPYYLVSQGSSGSDQPHLEALAMILAAFRPDTKAALKEAGLIAPTVQMVYRRARVGVRSRAAYLSGAAHPTVFRASDIDLARMVSLANAIAPEDIPPMVRLKVLEETTAQPGVDHFGAGLREVLFDTPSAIARIWRSQTGRRSMVVTAADTVDPNGRALTFDWVVLRGDPERIRITPLTPDGRYAQIVMDWQAPRPAPGTPDLLSHRIDIGVFANNGVYDSAPAFLSVLLPRHETRRYDTGPDGAPRIREIRRDPAEGVYADPVLFPLMSWRDIYSYGPEGNLLGWQRDRAGEVTQYDAQGHRLLSAPGEAPVRTTPVHYALVPDEEDGLEIVEQDADSQP